MNPLHRHEKVKRNKRKTERKKEKIERTVALGQNNSIILKAEI